MVSFEEVVGELGTVLCAVLDTCFVVFRLIVVVLESEDIFIVVDNFGDESLVDTVVDNSVEAVVGVDIVLAVLDDGDARVTGVSELWTVLGVSCVVVLCFVEIIVEVVGSSLEAVNVCEVGLFFSVVLLSSGDDGTVDDVLETVVVVGFVVDGIILDLVKLELVVDDAVPVIVAKGLVVECLLVDIVGTVDVLVR